jgi:hypothetical protein
MFFNRKQTTPTIEAGDVVQESGDIGIFMYEAVSPYYTEERAGITRCYVIFVSADGKQTAADWVLRENMTLVEKGTATLAALASRIAA